MTASVRAEQVIDGPNLSVAVTVRPSTVIPALVWALAGHCEIVGARPGLMDRIANDPAIAQALTVTLTQREAWMLADDLTAAAHEPDGCAAGRCAGYAQHPSGLCDACEDTR